MQSVGVVVPDQPWERGGANRLTARPFGGGALYDPRAQMVKLWYRCTYLLTYPPTHPPTHLPSNVHPYIICLSVYRCGWRGLTGRTCLALSRDGQKFSKPPIARSQSADRSIRGRWTNIVLETSMNEAFEVIYPKP